MYIDIPNLPMQLEQSLAILNAIPAETLNTGVLLTAQTWFNRFLKTGTHPEDNLRYEVANIQVMDLETLLVDLVTPHDPSLAWRYYVKDRMIRFREDILISHDWKMFARML